MGLIVPVPVGKLVPVLTIGITSGVGALRMANHHTPKPITINKITTMRIISTLESFGLLGSIFRFSILFMISSKAISYAVIVGHQRQIQDKK